MARSSIYLIVVSVLVRIGFFLFGLYQDKYMNVKYTDIDYVVFSDASHYVYQGLSPYTRETYRYTPLLSWFLVPNEWWPSFGKFLFILSDIITGVLIVKLLQKSSKLTERKLLILSSIWLLNPMVITISTRGSSESVLTVFIMLSIYCLSLKKMALSAIFLGISIHFKIYPIIYLPSILLYLSGSGPSVVNLPLVKLINYTNLKYLLIVLVTLGIFNGTMYHIYGYEFLYHSYLYHLTRLDHRHNFSIYNICLYYKSAQPYMDTYHEGIRNIEKLAFIPQLLISSVLLPLFFARRNLINCFFLQTFAFVLFNKVVTSQYFIWFIIFLPNFLLDTRLMNLKGIWLLTLWILSQACWLFFAYKLEFLGESTFNGGLFYSSIGFYLSNCYILGEFIEDVKHKSNDVV